MRTSIAKDCAGLIDDQVAAKSGMGGLALKATYGMVKGVGKEYIPGAIGRLLPDTFAALDPIWTEGVQSGDPVDYLSQHRSRAADMILSVTDTRIEKSNNKIVRSAYNKLRKSVKNDVEASVPELAKIIHTYA
ncbi:MAG: hypothetical protein VKL39_07505 [Leptolyngbyaceae bacterium]|nr:hypothetical protein [Leptolyngbyaceae bacterium]